LKVCGNASAWYFNRDSVALPGFHVFFKERADDQMNITRKFMEYQNKRGGRVILKDIPAPPKQEGWTPLEGMEATIQVETSQTKAISDLIALADRVNDHDFSRFLSNFLNEQVIDLKELADHVTQLKRVGPGIGEYLYDRNSLNESYFDKIDRNSY
ncbi:unnamed protein product, partial [Medioppia subpectinata]